MVPMPEADLVETTLRAREIARRFNVSLACVYGWSRTGVLPSRKVGKIRLFDRESVEALLGSRERKEIQ